MFLKTNCNRNSIERKATIFWKHKYSLYLEPKRCNPDAGRYINSFHSEKARDAGIHAQTHTRVCAHTRTHAHTPTHINTD